jgi:hypothetical protein
MSRPPRGEVSDAKRETYVLTFFDDNLAAFIILTISVSERLLSFSTAVASMKPYTEASMDLFAPSLKSCDFPSMAVP